MNNKNYTSLAREVLRVQVSAIRKAAQSLKDARGLTAEQARRAEAEWTRLETEASELEKGENHSLYTKQWLDQKASELRYADERAMQADLDAVNALSEAFTAAGQAKNDKLNNLYDNAIIQARVLSEDGLDRGEQGISKRDVLRQFERLSAGEGDNDKTGRYLRFSAGGSVNRAYVLASGRYAVVEEGSSEGGTE